MSGGLFEIRDASDFFGIIVRVLESYRSTYAKRPEDLLLLVLGLSHLCDWIAPGYNPKKAPRNAVEQFAQALSKDPDYQRVRLLANHTKHQERSLPETQTSSYVELMDDRDTPIDSWLDFDIGPTSAHEYGDRNLSDVFESVAVFYQQHWFNLSVERRLP